MSDPASTLLARVYEQLLLLNARMDDLSARLETHIAASVAERAELRNTLTAEVRGAVLAIRAETRQISAVVRRTDLTLAELDALLRQDDPYADLGMREYGG